MSNPLKQIGITSDKKPVMAGAFQMADTHGLPLADSFQQAQNQGMVLSIPHYFASAMEQGWDDVITFEKIEQALHDNLLFPDMERIKNGCISMFMQFQKPGEQDAREIGKRMREYLEQSCVVQPQT